MIGRWLIDTADGQAQAGSPVVGEPTTWLIESVARFGSVDTRCA
jgi:hypothetical protein